MTNSFQNLIDHLDPQKMQPLMENLLVVWSKTRDELLAIADYLEMLSGAV